MRKTENKNKILDVAVFFIFIFFYVAVLKHGPKYL